MLNEHTICRVTSYWASHLGVPIAELFAEPFPIVIHGHELSDYCGVFALFRGGAVIISVPQGFGDTVRAILPEPPICPATFAEAFRVQGLVTIGPAYIGYAEAVPLPSHPARLLTGRDSEALESLQAGCDRIEWEHGGSDLDDCPSFGIFVWGQLVALAGYEVWGGNIAHISVITHPGFRSQGFGTSAVTHAARSALASGLIAQYRTLESNSPSMRIAKALGFCHYATSVAVRLNQNP